ncbi:GtrA family protein [Ruegeria lacuscaerulensis]|uniref:GtrA family protein n=1 Tax=Ruegeria lacuscaerulensis TaxID=55218 RepID=UPI00147A50C4|nr:GtrA family protein [Ruegeria lacuscaerulensis]
MRFLRFTAISGIGLVVDIAAALFLHRVIGFPLWLSATLSFLVVGACNYLIFEFWLFRSETSAVSMRRLAGVLLSATFAGCARIATIVILESFVDVVMTANWLRDVLILLAGAGVSLTVNFIINSRVVFGRNMQELPPEEL